MIQKPKIQYVGQFYVYGSEARALAPKQKELPEIIQKPLQKLEAVEKVHVDLVALVAIGVCIFMLATMFLGLEQLQADWEEYRVMSSRVTSLREDNHVKMEAYHAHYRHAMVRDKAESMGMIPKAEAQHMTVTVTPPEVEPEAGWLENLRWFVSGLFA